MLFSPHHYLLPYFSPTHLFDTQYPKQVRLYLRAIADTTTDTLHYYTY